MHNNEYVYNTLAHGNFCEESRKAQELPLCKITTDIPHKMGQNDWQMLDKIDKTEGVRKIALFVCGI